jgi:MFS family permease
MNALMVVVMQMFISKQVKKFSTNLVMAAGSLLYALAYLSYGLVKTIPLFFVVMAVMTIGEMVLSPTQQKAIADFAPESMRGRYMAISSFIWVIPSSVSTLIAGFIMDNWNSNYVWYLSFLLGAISIFGYLGLHRKDEKVVVPTAKESVMESAE